jgi:hypothetical protein
MGSNPGEHEGGITMEGKNLIITVNESYAAMKNGIRQHLTSAAEDFFAIGYYLRQIGEEKLYIQDGYADIWDFAQGEYGLSKSTASRFIAINARFGIDGGEHMDQKYIGMGSSKLQEMLGLDDEELAYVTPETTVKEIRTMKAAKKDGQTAKKPAKQQETQRVYSSAEILREKAQLQHEIETYEHFGVVDARMQRAQMLLDAITMLETRTKKLEAKAG